jgi:hypothetical protein
MTGFDGSVLFAVLRSISEASKYIPGLAMVFVVLVIGLVVTLARMWFLTFRHTNPEAVTASQTHWHEERRIP